MRIDPGPSRTALARAPRSVGPAVRCERMLDGALCQSAFFARLPGFNGKLRASITGALAADAEVAYISACAEHGTRVGRSDTGHS